MKIKSFFLLASLITVGIFSSSCKKDQFISKGQLSFSVDTLIFDTVFTTIGSTTQQFKIYNPDKKKGVKIEEIELVGGSSSPFRINIDGLKGTYHSGINLEANDSLFVFVEVTLAVNNQSLPLIIEDSIRFRTNGKDQYVNLAVWGQDAYFHYKDVISPVANDTTWANDKPHVIYNYAAVDSAKTLNIPAGTRIHLHKNSLLYVYKGSLNVNGSYENEVVFEGDRLESFYKDVQGQWYGIYFQEARPSTINYAIIKNGTVGIHTFSANSSNTDYTLKITNTKIINHASYGVFLYSGSAIKMENTIISNCYRNAFFVLQGGTFNINHCNILGYGNSKEQNIAFAVKNYFTQNGQTNVASIPEGKVYNSIIYGYQSDEIALDTLNPQGAVTLNFDFRNVLIKKEKIASHSMFKNIIWNENPNFKEATKYDFTFETSSVIYQKGFLTSVIRDIFNKNRKNPPDLGAIEKI
jgi:hypothetical protein